MFTSYDMLAAIFLICATGIVVWRSSYKVFIARRALEDEAIRSHSRLISKIRALDAKLVVLEGHASRYFNAMHNSPGGGYASVLGIQQEIHKVAEDIATYMTKREYEAAMELIKYLDGDIFKPYPQLLSLTRGDLNLLQDWEFNADKAILRLCSTLEHSSESNSKIYKPQPEAPNGRGRKPTLLSVNELRDLIDAARDQR